MRTPLNLLKQLGNIAASKECKTFTKKEEEVMFNACLEYLIPISKSPLPPTATY